MNEQQEQIYMDALAQRAYLRELAEKMDQMQARRWEDARRMTGGGSLSHGLNLMDATAVISE